MATIEKPAIFEAPGEAGSPVELKERYDNFIGGEWVPPIDGRVPREPHARRPASRSARSPSSAAGRHRARARRRPRRQGRLGRALADRALARCSTRSPTRSRTNLEMLAVAESWENGKPVRETLAADIPLAPTTSATSPA